MQELLLDFLAVPLLGEEDRLSLRNLVGDGVGLGLESARQLVFLALERVVELDVLAGVRAGNVQFADSLILTVAVELMPNVFASSVALVEFDERLLTREDWGEEEWSYIFGL